MSTGIDIQKLDLSVARDRIQQAGSSLNFDQAAVSDAVQACTDLIAVLEESSRWSMNLEKIDGLDKFNSAQALSKGLGDRGGEADGGFRQAVTEHLLTVKTLRDAIEKAGKGYIDTDGKIQTDFTSLNTNPTAGSGLPDHMVTEKDITLSGEPKKSAEPEPSPSPVKSPSEPTNLTPTGRF
ncbi:hypothetical protein GTV32_15105 [Gordonia sp. SID5947]|uniref:hypothetical protein n=1 Tax=Gordonia sp. SID5947 TaxID=2690315 RepID=UPI0013722241|nr:hypothetical protein [Gordonia sp. SID5947]MYR07548.1 hypothetical protein [Gordonia sp. SID5947]